tara:strand:+ start:7188 stop:7805 length:618 start_codon:yes stop_codon:yes gene_type:complete
MVMKLDLYNILQLTSAISPLLVTFLLVMISLFNQNLKGLVYLGGVLLASVINLFLGYTFFSESNKKDSNASVICDFIQLPYLTNFNVPSSSALFLSFTLTYLTTPMLISGQINPSIITVLSIFIAIDAVSKIRNKCTNSMGVVSGILLGGILGLGWFSAFKGTGNEHLLYYNELQSNNVQCSRPSKQTFKCTVYKNGNVISESIA